MKYLLLVGLILGSSVWGEGKKVVIPSKPMECFTQLASRMGYSEFTDHYIKETVTSGLKGGRAVSKTYLYCSRLLALEDLIATISEGKGS
mgnify:CR=1 FL=1